MRRTHFTLRLVNEGDSEHMFSGVIRDLYLPRNCGTVLQRTNAHGYGALHALRVARELQRSTAHNAYGILVDTDAHWSDRDRDLARRSRITVIANTPCLEAILLQVAGYRAYPSSHDNKTAFEDRFAGPAHRDGIIERNFSREMFDGARNRVAAINALLSFIRR